MCAILKGPTKINDEGILMAVMGHNRLFWGMGERFHVDYTYVYKKILVRKPWYLTGDGSAGRSAKGCVCSVGRCA